MKKLFYSIFALVSVVFALTSCEDIPAPYDIPHKGTTDVIAPTGDGTAANPYNVAAIDSILDSGYSTEDDEQNPYYYITGVICSRPSIETSYGNATYYISDDGTSTNQFYIYRSLSFNGAKFTSTDDLQYGDTVVVYTQVYSYSGTYETRSGVCKLISVKRNGQSQGGGGSSEGTVTPAGTGTQADPFNVAAAVKYVTSLGADVTSDKEVYIKGKVLSNTTTDATISSYGNMSFTIVDEGDEATTFYAFQVYGPGKQKFTSVDQIKAGQTVVICGKVVNYKGNTPETVGKGAAYVVSIDGSGTSGGGDTPTTDGGTKDKPYTVAQALSVAGALQKSSTSASYLSSEVYVKGKISKISDTTLSSYGNITYYISDDGTESSELEVYRGFSFGGAKFTSISDIKVGDAVVICGKLQNWLGTYEFTSGSSIYSLNGKTSDGGSSGDDSGSTEAGGVNISGTTVTLNNSAVTAGSSSVTIDLNTLGLSNAAEAGTVTLSDGSTIVFDKGTGTNVPKFYTATKGVRVYGGNTVTFNGANTIAKIVMTCDSYNGTDYVGQTTATVSFNGKTAVYTNAGSGTTQLRVQTITIYYANSAAKRYAHRR